MAAMFTRKNLQLALRREAQAWVLRLASGQATEADGAAFRQWCGQSVEHARAFKETRAAWQALQPAARRARAEQMARARARAPGRRAFLGGALAACGAYLAFRPPLDLWPAVSELAADYRSGAGEQREVALGEDATVQMNTRTRINVSAQARGERVDLLAGEVELRAGARPVSLSAGAGSVTVRDACVNVRYTDAQVRVTCLEGVARVRGPGGELALAAPRQVLLGADGLGAPRDADLAAISGWRRGVLEFNDVPLAQVVDEINRYRAGRILLMGDRLAGSRVQARFPLDQLADAALLIRDVYGARVTTLPGGIVLLS
jgi:ferric-dicitrate binding protein FerR (iron transport regulator)